MSTPPNSDELAAAIVAEALAGYADTLPASLLELVRESLTLTLLTHPDGPTLLRRASPDPRVASSGEVVQPTGADETAPSGAARREGSSGRSA